MNSIRGDRIPGSCPDNPRVARRLGHLGGPGPYEIDGRNRKRPPGKRLEGRGLREDRHANRNEVKKAWKESWPKPYEDRKSATFIHHGPMAGGHERRPASRASIKIGEEASRGKKSLLSPEVLLPEKSGMQPFNAKGRSYPFRNPRSPVNPSPVLSGPPWPVSCGLHGLTRSLPPRRSRDDVDGQPFPPSPHAPALPPSACGPPSWPAMPGGW